MTKKKQKKPGSSLAVPTVTKLDPVRFAGKWFELARIPVFIARDWTGTSETYSCSPAGEWKLSYEGFKASPEGPARKWGLRLRTLDPSRPGEMEASFLPFLWMKYRLVHVSADYRFMIATGSSMKYLWLLGKERIPPEKEYRHLVWEAKERGFDTSRLMRVNQSGLPG
jgi:lipocalin